MFISKQLLILNKSGSYLKNGIISRISFTNALRDCNITPNTETPIQIELPARTYGPSHCRIYAGNFPSVTSILDATRSKSNLFALLNWRQKQITDLGKAGFDEKVANTRQNGTTFHEAVKSYLLSGHQPEVLDANQGHWKSVAHVLEDIDQVIALESVVVHPELDYAGTLDGLVSYQGKLCLIDWKTSSRKRTKLKDCFSYPHQIVAYAGALNFDTNYAPLKVSCGLLVLAYPDGSPADTIWMTPETCKQYWDEWLARIQQYHELRETHSPKDGRKLSELAQYAGGVPVIHQPFRNTNDSIETEGKEPLYTGDPRALYEDAIDVLGIDPSLVEFSEDFDYYIDYDTPA